MSSILACEQLTKTYGLGAMAECALRGVSLNFERGERCVMLGPSGSGKTTLLSIFGCLLTPTTGSLSIDGEAVDFSQRERLVRMRRERLGFVFQHAQLLPFLTVDENLRAVANNGGLVAGETASRIVSLTSQLGIDNLLRRRPGELSGGQRQRVAIARAMLNHPSIVLADEPTAALDWENGRAAIRMLVDQARLENALLLVVTHDTRLVPLFDRVLHLESGEILSEHRAAEAAQQV